MLSVEHIQTGSLEGAGLLPIASYDPFQPRFVANLKEHILAGYPIILRLHPGVVYPMPDDALVNKVDREGHVVTIVGYDDSNDSFVVGDPWREEWGGIRSGLTSLTAQDIAMLTCNGTCVQISMCATLNVSARIEALSVSESALIVEVAAPNRPHAKCELRSITDIVASIKLPAGLKTENARQIAAVMTPSSGVRFEWRLDENDATDGDIELAVSGVGMGYDPYPYKDVVGTKAFISVKSVIDAKERELELA